MTKYITIGVIGLLLLMLSFNGCGTYNSMVEKQETVDQQWAQVQNVYQRRSDLIPNLVSTVSGMANFEKSTLTSVIEARAKATSVNIDASKLTPQTFSTFQQSQGEITSALSRLMVVSEKYPDLKSDKSFLQLQEQLEQTENRIAVERNKFNITIKDYNTYIRTFPKNLYAKFFDFDKKPYFESEKGANKASVVKFN